MSTPVPLPRPARPQVPLAEVQGTLALDLAPRQAPPRPGPVEAPFVPLARAEAGDQRRLEAWAHRFGQAVAEVVGGDRPVTQLLRWCSEEVYDEIARRSRLIAAAGQYRPGERRVQPVRPKVARAHPCFISPEIAEVALHVRYGHRSRALAVRFEWVRERWLCTALEFA